jgi:hypothetical protein
MTQLVTDLCVQQSLPLVLHELGTDVFTAVRLAGAFAVAPAAELPANLARLGPSLNINARNSKLSTVPTRTPARPHLARGR